MFFKDESTEITLHNNSYSTDDVYFGLVRNEDDIIKKESGYKKYAFNLLVSDRIGYHRDIPDTRDER